MSGTTCEKFVRNAWKKELCSNCFKSKDEHVEKKWDVSTMVKSVSLPLPDPPNRGILKTNKLPPSNLKNVAFHENECEIIGFGGEDLHSDDEDDDICPLPKRQSIDEPDTAEDKSLEKLTKSNTDFNSIGSNLLGAAQPVQPLRLGNQVTDDNGAKKTLLVSVTPFSATSLLNTNSRGLVKESIQVTEDSLKKDIDKESSLKMVEVGIKRSQPLDKNLRYRLNKETIIEKPVNASQPALEPEDPSVNTKNDKLTTSTKVANLLDKAKKKVHQLHVINDLQHSKAKSNESKLNEANKCVVLDLYNIKDLQEHDSQNVKNEDDASLDAKVENDAELISDKTCEITKGGAESNTDERKEGGSIKNDCSTVRNAECEPDGACFDVLDNYEGIVGGEEVTVFSVDSNDKVGSICEVERQAPDGAQEPSPPALPASPPPTAHPRLSFLHQAASPPIFRSLEKPKLPAKPSVIPSRKQAFQIFSVRPKSPSKEGFLDDTPGDPCSDSVKKRPAPQPPLFESSGIKLRSTVSSESLIKMTKSGYSTTPHVRSDVSLALNRRSFSLSQDSLLDSDVNDIHNKKKASRGRFSLRRFLHIGKNNKEMKESGKREYRIDNWGSCEAGPPPQSRTKPQIIHPVELTRLQLDPPQPQCHDVNRRGSSSASSSSDDNRDLDVLSDSSTSQSTGDTAIVEATVIVRSDPKQKPLPPPRISNSYQGEKPSRPPCSINMSSAPVASAYVNIGEVRSSLTPHKPARSGSLREADGKKKVRGDGNILKTEYWTGSLRGTSKCAPLISQPEDSGYESFDVSLSTNESNPSSQTSSLINEENLYECVQVGSNTIRRNDQKYDRRSDMNLRSADSDYAKFRFLRSTSVPHCVADIDADIYSPYSFCGSEQGEDDYEWSPTSGRFQKVSRLKMKKGRSIVHKNLEDNYSAVVIANHEALLQVVQQMHQVPVAPSALRPLIAASNLRWSDFTVVKDHRSVTVGQRTFYSALWGLEPVTLCLAPEESAGSFHGKPPFNLQPLTQLHDLVPAYYVSPGSLQDTLLVQCSISVISRIQIEPLESFCRSMSKMPLTDDSQKEIHFILLLIINALKTQHQATGVEEVPVGLKNVLVCREEHDAHPWICWLPAQDDPTISLCGCLMELLSSLPTTDLSPLLETTLRAEKAGSLSHAKALLEFTLWGPADILFEKRSRGAALQRWLDLERASVLNGLVRTRSELSVFEEWHLLFLAHTNAKILNDASISLESQETNA